MSPRRSPQAQSQAWIVVALAALFFGMVMMGQRQQRLADDLEEEKENPDVVLIQRRSLHSPYWIRPGLVGRPGGLRRPLLRARRGFAGYRFH